MGYRDQNGTVHGPYALDRAKIHDKWLALQGKPGAPLEDDHTGTCVQSGTGLLATLYIQGFEQGYIQYCGSGAAEYVAYPKTYLPDTKIAYNGWNSSVTAHNNGGATEVSITFYQADGKVADSRAYDPHLATNANWTLETSSLASDETNPINNVAGSAVVAAEADTSVVVENLNSSTGSDYAYNGVAAGSPINSDWGQVGTTIHLPLLMNNNYGWSTSVTILNAGNSTATFDFDYFGQNSGGPYQGPQGSLAPNASVTYSQFGSPCPTVGAGRITSDQPLAVIVQEYAGNVYAAYNGFRSGATVVNLPLIMANNYGWHTGIAVQNLGSAATNITVNYYPSPGYPNRNPETVYNVQPYATAIFNQSGGQWGSTRWVGSARVTDSQPLAAIVNQAATGKASCYNSFANGSGSIILPLIRNNADG